jgi:hypothetical protein
MHYSDENVMVLIFKANIAYSLGKHNSKFKEDSKDNTKSSNF